MSYKVNLQIPTGCVIKREGFRRIVYKLVPRLSLKGRVVKDKIPIGHIDNDTDLLDPNENYYWFYDEEENEVERPAIVPSIRSIGRAYLFRRICQRLGLVEILEECFLDESSELVLTAALFMFARGNVFRRIESFCEENTIWEIPLTLQYATKLFQTIGTYTTQEFFKLWMKAKPSGTLIAYDSQVLTPALPSDLVSDWRPNDSNIYASHLSFGCYVSLETNLPMFYIVYPAPIVNKSNLDNLTELNAKLKVKDKDVVFALFPEFFSQTNLRFMAKKGLTFIVELDIDHPMIKETVAELGKDIKNSFHNYIISASGLFFCNSAEGSYYGTSATLHLCHDSFQNFRLLQEAMFRHDNRKEIMEQLERMTPEQAKDPGFGWIVDLAKDGTFTFRSDDDLINAKFKNWGQSAFLSNSKLSSKEVIKASQFKKTIEKRYINLFNRVDDDKTKPFFDEIREGKLLCAFIALIVETEFRLRLDSLLTKKSWDMELALAELDRIRVIKDGDGFRAPDPLNLTQRTLLELFELDEADLQAYVKGERR
ncbi:MAG: hypothetical protein LBS60_13715 [Deltaproteobacteria bacterium]|jgi:hypothetical protein|nr:hypothetical protein [Deltaproteobacteria bacterium]